MAQVKSWLRKLLNAMGAAKETKSKPKQNKKRSGIVSVVALIIPVARVQSLAWELLHADSMANK